MVITKFPENVHFTNTCYETLQNLLQKYKTANEIAGHLSSNLFAVICLYIKKYESFESGFRNISYYAQIDFDNLETHTDRCNHSIVAVSLKTI